MRHAVIDRRALLAGVAFSASAFPLAAPAQGLSPADARLDALLTQQFDEGLRESPPAATLLGLDVGALAPLRSRLPDWSAAGRARIRAANARKLAELKALGRNGLSSGAQINYDCAEFDLSAAVRLDRFAYHTNGFGHRAGPYGVTQLGGFYTGLSNFFDIQHPVKSKDDADAYMARLDAVPGLVDADSEIVRANAAMGVIAPRFILDQAILQLKRLRDGEARGKTLVRSIARRGATYGGDYEDRAAAAFDGPIRAALTRQIDLLSSLQPRAGDVAGVKRLPDGEAYYAACLRLHTTTTMTAAEIHRLGREQVADLNSRIEGLLRAQGLTQGTIRERLDSLSRAPGQVFANTDAGRAELLAFLNERLRTVTARCPRLFARMPTAPYEIRRVPPETENGAPGGSAQRGSLDGTRPGVFFINLRDTAEWPRWTLPTLAYHEGAPGHLFEGALALQNGDQPIYRQAASATANAEGWGLYAEQLADELGMYDDDPIGKIGYLASYNFRASRLVVDTGMHSMGWTRDQAIEFMIANSSLSPTAARTEVDRYIVYPGQACSYKVGQVAISRLRHEFESQPGFDIKRFHSAVLDGGQMPLTVLEARVRGMMRTASA